MRRIFDNNLLECYIEKHKIKSIFDDDILTHAQLQLFHQGQFILESGYELQYYYMFVEGKVKISYVFENGKAILLKFYKDFNCLGDVELLRNEPIRCNVEAMEDSYFIAIPADLLRKTYLNNPKFLHHIINCLSDKFYAVCNNSSYNLAYPLINRLCSYLVEHLTGENHIILQSSFTEIAQFLGTTYRHLNRTFKELESQSIIRCENKTVFILDEGRLREMSKNEFVKSLEY